MVIKYRYSGKLGRRQFRLLKLQPGHPNDQIDVVLCIVGLSDHPTYEALSYEWGKSKAIEFVTCVGKNIAINLSLSTALRQLRDRSSPRTLWIDAICIDQENIAEKSEQVALMRSIFSQATTVLVWLGLESHRTSDAFQMLPILARMFVVREVKKAGEGEWRPLGWDDLGEEEVSTRNEDRSLWEAIYEVFERPYFSRTWIVQEIAVANTSKVLCGALEISWLRFSWAAAYVSRSAYHLHHSPTDKGLARIAAISALRANYQNGRPLKLHEACVIGQQLRATDGRDKVYGLLGLCSCQASTSPLKIDYSLPIRTVYYRAAQKSILEHQDLRICHCQTFAPKYIEMLPSWAPDWSTMSDRPPVIALRPHNRPRSMLKGKISFVKDSMRLKGHFIDSITHVSKKLSCEEPLPDIHKIMIYLSKGDLAARMPEDDGSEVGTNTLEQAIRMLKHKTYRGQQTMYDALWRSLLANTATFTTAQPEFRQHFDAVVDSLRLRARGISWEKTKVGDHPRFDFESQARLLLDVEAQGLCRRIGEQSSAPYFRELVNTIEGRVFFVTKDGYMGIGSAGIAPDDQVAVLTGGWSPFILEQRGSFFVMKGDAYVHLLEDPRSHKNFKARSNIIEIR